MYDGALVIIIHLSYANRTKGERLLHNDDYRRNNMPYVNDIMCHVFALCYALYGN